MAAIVNIFDKMSFAVFLTRYSRSRQPVTVVRVATSCPCLSAKQVPIRIGPAETRTLVLCFDPSDEPDFQGGLSIEVAGHDENDSTVFTTRVNVDVRAQSMAALQRQTSPEKEGLR